MRAVLYERSQTQGHTLCHSTYTKSPAGRGDAGAEGRAGGGDGIHQGTRNVLDLYLGGMFVKFHQSGYLMCVYFMYVIFQ